MWTCPKCGREFKKMNQGHYCGKAPETVNEYIELQDTQAHAHLTELRNVILSTIPDVKERILWSMPYFIKGEASISMAACKKHISFYVDAETIEYFLQFGTDFTVKKNAIYLPYAKELPVEILKNIVKRCFREEDL